MQRLDPKALSMWRVSRAIGLAFVLLVCSAVWLLFLSEADDVPLTMRLMLVAVPVTLQALNLAVYPPIEYRQWAYLITPDRIEIRKGIFFHSAQIIPISRIQHVTVSEGPLARRFRLATVTVNTAGGAFRIEGLAKSTADTICALLKDAVNQKLATG